MVNSTELTNIEELHVNWGVFSDDEARTIERGLKTGAYEHLSAMIQSVTPEKAEEIARIQALLRPRSFKFESRVKKEFDVWMEQNGGRITPEIEADFQKRMNEEREQALANLGNGAPVSVKTDDNGKTTGALAGAFTPESVAPATSTGTGIITDLDKIAGLGVASVKKLNDSGIFTIAELQAKSHEDRVKILNPLVASTVKKYFDLNN